MRGPTNICADSFLMNLIQNPQGLKWRIFKICFKNPDSVSSDMLFFVEV